MMKRASSCILFFAFVLLSVGLFAQSYTGELRLTVTDPSGAGVKSTVKLVSEANEYQYTFTTDEHGSLDAKRLPYGIYQVQIQAASFAQLNDSVEIRSALPLDRSIKLKVASVSESLNVTAPTTLVDPYRSGSVNQIGKIGRAHV